MARFITLEGLRGSGKSTVAARLAERLGMTDVVVIDGAFAPALQLLDEDPAAVDARHAAYAAALLHCGRRVQALLGRGESCIVDSWIDRTNLTHLVLGSSLPEIKPAWLPHPDVALWLEVPAAMRASRIASRECPTTYWKGLLEDHTDRLAELYRARCPDLVPIDASGPVDDVVSGAASAVLARLEEHHVPVRTH